MKGKTQRTIFIFAVMCLSLLVSTQANAQRYSGRATAIKTTVGNPLTNPLTTAINDTGELPSAGGNINLTSNSTVILSGALTAGTSTSRTRGGALGGNPNASHSEASVANLNFSVLGNTITATAVSTVTDCSCPTGTCTGSTTIAGLTLNGSSVTVTGSANQTIDLRLGGLITGAIVGTLVINEQIDGAGSKTVNGLHIRVTDSITGIATDVVIASSHSDIICNPAAADNFYSGRAYGIGSTVTVNDLILGTTSSVETIVADTGPLPGSGGSIGPVIVAGANIPSVATSGTLTSNTSGGISGGIRRSDSSAEVQNLNVTVAGFVITATVLNSQTVCTCALGGTTSTCSGGAVITNLNILAPALATVVVTGAGSPNETRTYSILGVVVLTIILNEQIPESPTTTGSITVNALHIITSTNVPLISTSTTDTVIASSHSDIVCGTIGPSASTVSVSGQVTNGFGRGLMRAMIVVTDPLNGDVRTTNSNAFGNYQIEGLRAGGFYVIHVRAKGYEFDPISFVLTDDLSGLDLVPIANRKE